MLIARNLNRKDFAKAEELINTLPSTSIDKEERIAILYTEQGRYPDCLIRFLMPRITQSFACP